MEMPRDLDTPVHAGAGRVKRDKDEFRQVFRPVMFKASCFTKVKQPCDMRLKARAACGLKDAAIQMCGKLALQTCLARALPVLKM